MMDFHIHSRFSDGDFPVSTIIETARRIGLKEIAVTDHYNTAKTYSVAPEDLERYLDTIDAVTADIEDDFICLKGLEINTLDLLLRNRILPPDSALERLDFILFEYISDKPMEGIPLMHLQPFLSRLPIPAGLAHTDLAKAFPGQSPADVIRRLEDAGLFIELNESYARPGEDMPFYFHLEPYFLAAKGRNIRFSVGSDMHHSLQQLGAMQAFRYLNSIGLGDQIADSAFFRRFREHANHQ